MELDGKKLVIYGLALGVAFLYLQLRKKKDLNAVPAISGTRGPISRFLASLYFVTHAVEVVGGGYHQHRGGVFRVPILFGDWFYVAGGGKRAQEMANAPDHVLSFNEAIVEGTQVNYTLGPEIVMNPYHAMVIRGTLTRNLGRCFPLIREEITHAFDHVLGLVDNDWKLVPVRSSILQVVARTSNRLFVGLPLCRNTEYLKLNIDFAIAVFLRAQLIGILPDLLKPILGPVFSTRKSSRRRVLKFLGPLLEQRLDQEKECGRDWPDRPNDLISWLLDSAQAEQRTAADLAMRMLTVNFAAIHTTSMTLTDALYDLTTYPEHIAPMREEAERVVSAEGWTKAALGNMHKIDSFLRETTRMGGLGPFAMGRKVVAKDGFTFLDGTTIPHGAMLIVPANAIHHDEEIFDKPDVFDGFRFSRQREAISVNTAEKMKIEEPMPPIADTNAPAPNVFTRHLVSTGPDHLVFGHGRHACPGRFFAATELKAMLAHILINYDIKAETEGVRPRDIAFGMFRSPSATGRIWIRKKVKGI